MKRLLSLTLLLLFIPLEALSAQITLNWSGLTKVPTTYKIFSSTTAGVYDFSKPALECAGSLSRLTVQSLTNNTTYYFVVRGYTGVEESTSSPEVHAIALDSNPTQSLTTRFVNVWYNRKAYEYSGTTDKNITVSWAACLNADSYEVRLVNLDRGSEITLSSGRVTTNKIVFRLPKTGHYSVKVRSCKDNYTECSDWAYSTNSGDAVINNEANGWCVYGGVAAPGAIIIQ